MRVVLQVREIVECEHRIGCQFGPGRLFDGRQRLAGAVLLQKGRKRALGWLLKVTPKVTIRMSPGLAESRGNSACCPNHMASSPPQKPTGPTRWLISPTLNLSRSAGKQSSNFHERKAK